MLFILQTFFLQQPVPFQQRPCLKETRVFSLGHCACESFWKKVLQYFLCRVTTVTEIDAAVIFQYLHCDFYYTCDIKRWYRNTVAVIWALSMSSQFGIECEGRWFPSYGKRDLGRKIMISEGPLHHIVLIREAEGWKAPSSSHCGQLFEKSCVTKYYSDYYSANTKMWETGAYFSPLLQLQIRRNTWKLRLSLLQ